MWISKAPCELVSEILAVVRDNIIIMSGHLRDHLFTFKEGITTRASHYHEYEHTCGMNLRVREMRRTL